LTILSDILTVLGNILSSMVAGASSLLGIDPALAWLGLLSLGLALLLWAGWRLNRWWQGVRFGMSRRKGKRGEDIGAELLEDAGYTILDDQSELEVEWIVDGVSETYEVRADFLVERDGLKYVADAKFGKVAEIGNAGTRRQLLEYAVVYDCDGVLLVNASEKRIHKIDFPLLSKRAG